MQKVSGKADCIIYQSLINENAILFHLVLRYHREVFIELYEQFSKGKEKYLKLQIAWHKSCSLFLLPKDIHTSTVLPGFNEEDADIRKMWQDFCDFHSTTPATTCNNIMIHISSIVYHVMLEHVHTFTSPQPQSHHFDTASCSTDDDDVYYRFGGAALCSMLKTRYKHIRKCAEEKIATISQEITILQSMATKDKLFLPSYLKYRDNGFMYTPCVAFVQFFREVDMCVQEVVNSDGFEKHQDDLVKVAHLYLDAKAPELRKKFEELLHEKLSEEVTSNDAICNVFTELNRKLCNARVEEFISVKRQKIASQKGQASTSGQNLRDNLLTHHTNLRTKVNLD